MAMPANEKKQTQKLNEREFASFCKRSDIEPHAGFILDRATLNQFKMIKL